jgi:ABC-2 type transport system permease protein
MWIRIRALILKETLAVLRDPKNRIALIAPPLMQLALFSFTGTLEVKNVTIGVLNQDAGKGSIELTQRFAGSPNFNRVQFVRSPEQLRDLIDRQSVLMGVQIPPDFSRRLTENRSPEIQLLLDGRRSNASQIAQGYLTSIVEQFNTDQRVAASITGEPVIVAARNWFNPNLDYLWFTVPSLVALITLQVSMNVTTMSVAREREMGTFDQLLVSPLQPIEIMLGKMVPAFILALAEATLFVVVAVLIFRIPFQGSLPLLYLGLIVFISSVVGIGLFISALAKTQQQALLGTFVVLFPALLMSGYASPIENMPGWLQPFTYVNPVRYMMVIVKGVFLKDMPFGEVWANTWPMLLIAAGTLGAATWLFRRRLG